MRTRVLPKEEWARLNEASGLPALLPYMSPEQVEIIVVEDGERIVASWSVLRVTHFEGLWIDPDYRNAGVVRRLMRKTMETARQWCGQFALTGANTAEVANMVRRIGGVRMPMDCFMVPVGR